MKIYLDEDIHPDVEALLRPVAEVKRAQRKGWDGLPDKEVYPKVVRAGFDLVITCNKSENSRRREGRFVANVLKELDCKREELPVPVIELWKEGIGNDWNKLKEVWPEFLAEIKGLAAKLGDIHEHRRAEAVAKLDRLEQAAALKREREQEPVIQQEKKITRER